MGQLDPDIVGAMLGPILDIPGVIVFTALISRFKLKKKRAGHARQRSGVGTGGR